METFEVSSLILTPGLKNYPSSLKVKCFYLHKDICNNLQEIEFDIKYKVYIFKMNCIKNCENSLSF